jgi:hypothetical protein
LPTLSRTLAALLTATIVVSAGSADAQARRRSVRSAPGPAPVPVAGVSTFGNIDRAVSEGRISANQGMLYKVFASYDDARLPQEFAGDDSAIADTTFLSEVAAKYETLPVDIQQQVAPFLIPPFHQNSWWHLRKQQVRSGQPATNAVTTYGFGITKPCTDCDLSFDWEFVPTANGKVKVWYDGSNGLDKVKAQGFATEIDQVIWPKLKALMGREPLPDEGDGWLGHSLGGDARLDIALVDIKRSITTARYVDGCRSAAWTYIQFNKTKPREEMAHELMHSFQYAFNSKVRGGDCTHEQEYRWLMESTAEWVKDYVYPGSTSPYNEQKFAPSYLDVPEVSLNEKSDPHWYGAYLFPFFLARLKGETTIVGQVWANTERVSSLQAFEEALQPLGGFEKVWPQFVLHNWNEDPVDEYRKLDQLTPRPLEHGGTTLAPGAVDAYLSLNVEVPHLSATYKRFVLNDSVNSFAFLNGLTFNVATEPRTFLNTFDLGEQYKWAAVTAEQKRGASVQAVLKKNGKWQTPEDWTNIPYKAFCRQKPDERIEEIVLIFANSNIEDGKVLQVQGEAPLLIVTDMGCRFDGVMDWTSSALSKQGFGDIDLKYKNTWEPRDPMEPVAHFLGYFYDVSGQVDWTVTGPVGPCGVSDGRTGVPIRSDLYTWSMNFAPKGSKGYRKGYYQLHIQDPVTYALHCPGTDVQMQPTFTLFPAISFDPLMYVTNVTGGALLGEKINELGTWRWDYKLKK